MKGFIVTLDALLAVILAGLMASAALALLKDSQKMDWTEVYLQRAMDDVLAVVDEGGMVTSTVDENRVEDTIGLLPPGICVRLQFYQKGSASPYATVTRADCGSPADRLSVARRQVLHFEDGSMDRWTVVLAEGWYK